MSLEIKNVGELLTVMLDGEIDHHRAKEIREKIDDAIEFNMPSLLILDFGGVTFMDSSGIGLVMGRYRLLQKKGAKLNLTNLPPNIYKVMKLAGIEKLAKLCKYVSRDGELPMDQISALGIKGKDILRGMTLSKMLYHQENGKAYQHFVCSESSAGAGRLV